MDNAMSLASTRQHSLSVSPTLSHFSHLSHLSRPVPKTRPRSAPGARRQSGLALPCRPILSFCSLFWTDSLPVLGMPHDTRAVTSAPHVAATRVDRWTTSRPRPVSSRLHHEREILCQSVLELFAVCYWRARQHAGVGRKLAAREKYRSMMVLLLALALEDDPRASHSPKPSSVA